MSENGRQTVVTGKYGAESGETVAGSVEGNNFVDGRAVGGVGVAVAGRIGRKRGEILLCERTECIHVDIANKHECIVGGV